jgi:hypothetical protein
MSAASELRANIERSNAIHQEYLNDSQLLERYRHFVAWQTDYLLPFYENLRSNRNYSAAVDFVVSDLTGIGVSDRDQNIARVAPIMSRMLPDKAVHTMAAAMHLNARVLQINLAVCRILYEGECSDSEITEADYCAAIRQASNLDECLELIQLTAEIGHSLDHVVRIPMVGPLLRAMRTPARLWGFAPMQAFLEKGYETFSALEDVDRFLDAITVRMTEVFTYLFTEPLENLGK